jgi:hypothetical protein
MSVEPVEYRGARHPGIGADLNVTQEKLGKATRMDWGITYALITGWATVSGLQIGVKGNQSD